jgi:hypothetical protein
VVHVVSGREIVFEEIAKPKVKVGGVLSRFVGGREVEDEGGEQVSQRLGLGRGGRLAVRDVRVFAAQHAPEPVDRGVRLIESSPCSQCDA